MQISELYGSDNELYQRLISSIGFGIHVALPVLCSRMMQINKQ